jgi:hypothetical protein
MMQASATYALRVRLTLSDVVRLRSYTAEAGLSGGRRTGADGSELQPELQPPVDRSVPSTVIGTYGLKEDQGLMDTYVDMR